MHFFDVRDELAGPIVKRVNNLKLIQKRLATIVCHLPNRPKMPRPKPVRRPRVTLDDVFHTSFHTIFSSNSTLSWLSRSRKLTCAACHASCSVKSSGFRAFLSGPCTPIKVHGESRRILSGTSSTNGIHSHSSHVLQIHNDFCVCMKCGKKASQRLYHLKDPCPKGKRTAYRDAVLKAAAEGTL